MEVTLLLNTHHLGQIPSQAHLVLTFTTPKPFLLHLSYEGAGTA